MAGSMNRVTLVGRLGKDPEIRSTQSGAKIANLTVATSESWNDKRTGERKEAVEWHRVTIFAEGLITIAERYLQKGDKLLVEGALMTRKWTDQNGQERHSTEIALRPFNSQLLMLGGPQRETGRGIDQEQWDREEADYRDEVGNRFSE